MGKYIDLANKSIAAVGGRENVSNVAHCMTRLRFYIKDMSRVNEEELKQIKGVLGVQILGNEVQTIIGTHVSLVYQDVVEAGSFNAMEPIGEDLDGSEKKPEKKGVFDTLVDIFAGCLTPTIPAITTMAFLKVLMVLLGPDVLHVLNPESGIYVFLDIACDAVSRYLPFLIAYTASRKFRTNTVISLAMAGILMSPTITSLLGAGASLSFFGIPVTLLDYSSTLLPMILIVYTQSWVEKLLNRIVPKVLNSMLVPLGTVLILLPISLCALGPLGNFVGEGLMVVLNWLYNVAGPIETTLAGAAFIFMTATGIGYPIFVLSLTALIQTGSDYMFMVLNPLFLYCIMGISLARFITAKTGDDRALGLSCFISQAVGAVSEPAMYGLIFPNKKILAVNCIANGLAGLYVGITHTGVTMVPALFGPLAFMKFSNLGTANFVNGCIACGIALIVSFVGAVLIYKGTKENKKIQEV